MAYTGKQLFTYVSFVYLVLVTTLSGYAASRTNRFSIPISKLLAGFTTALPIIAGLLLKGGNDLTKSQEHRRGAPPGQTVRPPLVTIANTIILIYSSVVLTLLGTHAAPGTALKCGLEEGWMKMFRQKNGEAIKTIQDAFNCCGFVNVNDRAWPFPNKEHPTTGLCKEKTERTQGCLGPWKREEQYMAWLLIVVVVLVFLWQAAIMVISTKKESWLHRVLPERVSNLISDEEQGLSNGHIAGYLTSYSDNVAGEVNEDGVESTPHRTIGEGVHRVRNATTSVEHEEEHQHHSTPENEWAR